jgi:hypothetical protein
VARETLGDRHPDTLTCISNLSSLLFTRGDFAAAETLVSEALAGQREVLGNGHPSTLLSGSNLALLEKAKCARLGRRW